MSCGEKNRLLVEYSAATDAFSTAVQELRKRIGTSSREEHQRLERVTVEARVKSEQTRLALEEHVVTHGCYAHFRRCSDNQRLWETDSLTSAA